MQITDNSQLVVGEADATHTSLGNRRHSRPILHSHREQLKRKHLAQDPIAAKEGDRRWDPDPSVISAHCINHVLLHFKSIPRKDQMPTTCQVTSAGRIYT